MSDGGTKDLNILKYLINDEYIGSIQDELKIAKITKPKSYEHFEYRLTKLKTSWEHYNELKKFIINKENEEFFKMLGITNIGKSIEKSIEEEKKKLNNAVVKVIEEVISIISGNKKISELVPESASTSLEKTAEAEETASAEKIGSQYIIKVRRIVAYVEKNTDKDKEINDLLKIGIDGSNDLLEELKEIIKEENANTNTKLGEMIKKVGVGNITKNIDWIIEEVLQAPKVFIVINDNPKIGFAKKTYDEQDKFMEYGYCIKDKAPKEEVDDKQFSRIFYNPFQKGGEELNDWKLSNKDISEKLAGGKDVVIFGFGASGSGKTYTLLEKSIGVKGNQYSVAQLIENKMNTLMSNGGKKWGILEDKYYVMDDKSRKTLDKDMAKKEIEKVRGAVVTRKCFDDNTDKLFIENITAGKIITNNVGVEGKFALDMIGQHNYNKSVKQLQINEINVTKMHEKLKACAKKKADRVRGESYSGKESTSDDRDPEPLLENGWKGEETKEALGYYLDLVRWSPNNVASSRGPRVIKYGYYDKNEGKETHIVVKKDDKIIDGKKNGNLIIVDMPGSESVTDIIKKTYDKLNILKGGPSEDGKGKWTYDGLKSKGLHTILKLPYIDVGAGEKADYFFNYKDEETDQNAIEKSINNLRESLLIGTLPTQELIEEKIEKIIKYAIKGLDKGEAKVQELGKSVSDNDEGMAIIIKNLFGMNINFKVDSGGKRTAAKIKKHYELKVFTSSFLYLIRTSYYVQIILFNLKNVFLSKAGKDTDVKWMDDHDKLKNMVNEPGEQDENVTAENNAIGEGGGFKGGDMEIPERDGSITGADGEVIKKNGLKLLFDNIIRKEEGAKSDSDPVMIVIGLINSNEEKDDKDHNKYIETMRYLSKLNPNTSAGCPPEDFVKLDKVGDNKREWVCLKNPKKCLDTTETKKEGGGRKTRKKRDKRRKYTIIKRIKHKMKSNKKKTKQNKKYNSSKKCLKKSFFKTRRNR